MIKIIRFLGEVILFLAGMIKFLSGALKFILLIGICMGILIFTMLATFEAFHFVTPMENASSYGMPLDIFDKDLWAWVVAVLGWTTMLYGVKKMFESDKEYEKSLKRSKETTSTWLESNN